MLIYRLERRDTIEQKHGDITAKVLRVQPTPDEYTVES